MIVIAGFLAGTLMALIFVAHMSMMFVTNPPAFVRNSDPEQNNLPRTILMVHGVALLVWPAIGIVTAVAYHAVRDEVSDAVFVLGVFAVVVMMAPVLVLLMRGRWIHLAAQFAAFFVIFAFLIPFLVAQAS